MSSDLNRSLDRIPGAEAVGPAPWIVVPPPGPRSRALAQRLGEVECAAITYQDADLPIFWARAQGARVEDVDGNRYLDITAAFAVASVGHGHPRVREAIVSQAQRLIHGMGDVHPSEAKVVFLEALQRVLPAPLGHAILGSSGSDAVEAARKVCARYTGRGRLLAFHGAYHGLSYGGLEATGRADFREPFLSQLAGTVSHLPFPDASEDWPDGDGQGALDRALRAVEAALDDVDGLGRDVGGILLEPIQGRAGTIVPPDGFLAGLRRLTQERGILLILDEVYTGFGRTGAMLACDHEGVVPDLLCLGKGMTGGMPFSACVGRPEVMAALGTSRGEALHTQTFLGHPLGAAAATAALGVIVDEDLPARARRLGAHARARLAALAARCPQVGRVRGRGLMIGVELVSDRASRAPAVGLGAEIMKAALREGLLLLPSGPLGNVIAISPPLVIEEAELDKALDILEGLLLGIRAGA